MFRNPWDYTVMENTARSRGRSVKATTEAGVSQDAARAFVGWLDPSDQIVRRIVRREALNERRSSPS